MLIKIKNFILADSDRNLVYRWRNSKEVSKYFIKDQISIETNEHWKKALFKKCPETIAFIIYADDTPCGCVYFSNIDYMNYSAEYGIFLANEAPKRQGVAYKASVLSIEHLYLNYKITNFSLKVFENNVKAIGLYKKLGFSFCGNSEQIEKGKQIITIKKMRKCYEHPI